MEDAHIAEGELYALETNANTNTNTNTNSSNNDNDNDNSNDKRIALPGHALFAVYDGHGGTFAAIYSGNNFLRILSKQRAFVRYTKMCNADSNDSNNDSNINSDTTAKSKKAARAARKMKYLEQALKQAFVETDYEIGMAVRGKSHMDANSPYHEGKTSTTTTTNINTNTTDTNTDTNTTARTVQEGAVMKAASDHLAAIEDRGDSGTTSCVVMITPESIVCANAGDSRSVFARRPEVGVVDATTTANNDDDNDNSTDTDTDTNNDATTTATATTNATLGKAVPLSFDHKPDDEQEMLRIRAAGGYVGGGRVEGDLAVSRGLGDFRFKEMPVVLNNTQLFPDESYDGNDDANDGNGNGNGVTSTSTTTNGTNMDTTDDEGEDTCNSNSNSSNTNNNNQHPQKPKQPIIFPPGDQKVSPIPDVIVHARNPERDEYVVVACDGIWDVVSNQQCVAELDQIMYDEGERDLGLVSEEILDTCLRYGSKDNMTAIVIQFPGCEKSYVDAAKAAPANKDVKDAEGSATTTATTTTTTTTTEGDKRQQEGVAGRRRKREEVHGVQHQQQQQQREEYGGGGGGDGGGGSGVESPSRAPL